MNTETLKKLLEDVKGGSLDIDSAIDQLRRWPIEDMGFATLDHHRNLRCGFPEVIFCPSKTTEQVRAIFSRLALHGHNVLATRASRETFQAVSSEHPTAEYNELARTIVLRQANGGQAVGHVGIVSAGTSDLPVAEEARVTAEIMGAAVTTHYDVGVAGLHRLLVRTRQLQDANALVVVAGMEGALASVVGGLVSCPVIAVPTSVGYGASFGGLAPLLTMLNSCAAGVSVVNIDNGFAGGYLAAMINSRCAARPGEAPEKIPPPTPDEE